MAKVVALADRLSRTQSRKHTAPIEAQILFFTGVRYERLGETGKPASARRSVRSKVK
ncbi:hypothetical protein [Rhizobium sp. Root708]|uniref:hypothetical protein n=1 Tax=Rhizobium sp. Root708 TaxID=1736592 RepID=UPI000AC84682|nr:hypothetical protein [Rhizobium sp. Root708]